MSQFEDLLNQARNHSDPQLILFVFAKATSQSEAKGLDHHRGTIEPLMCVDKLTSELSTFESLVKEADGHKSDWNFIFVSTLTGKNNKIPEPEKVDTYFRQITNAIAMGEDLSKYIIWDRNENPVLIG